MRFAFLLLLLGNLVLYFWGQGYLGQQDSGREPERLQRQVEPDKLHLAAAGLADAPAAAPAALAPPVPAPPPATACKRVEWLAADAAEALKTAAAALPGWEAERFPRKEDPAHWVAIPGLGNRAAADKKLAELRQLGVKEGDVVEDANVGPFAVSLGMFRSRPLAEALLQSLAKKGVRSAQLLQREPATRKFAVELRAPADQLDGKLPELLKDAPQANLLDCAAP